MKRHFYLIIIIFICISGISASFSQEQIDKPAEGTDIENRSDSEGGSSLSAENDDSQNKTGSSNMTEDKTVDEVKPVVSEKKSAEQKQVSEDVKKGRALNEKVTVSETDNEEDESTDTKEKTLQKQTRTRSDLYIIRRLREVDDEDYKYSRIPELKKENFIKQTELPVVETESNLQKEKEDVPLKSENEENTGLFGLSKSTSDILTKGSLLVLILIIFILYRLRSKGNSKTVLRRFPR